MVIDTDGEGRTQLEPVTLLNTHSTVEQMFRHGRHGEKQLGSEQGCRVDFIAMYCYTVIFSFIV